MRALAVLSSFALGLLLLCVPAALAAQTASSGPPSAATGHHAINPKQTNSLQWLFFNAATSFLGVPGLVSPVDGLQDEGLGFHADGTTRKAGGADATGSFSGQRAASYARSGWALGRQDWLYDDIMGIGRDAEGRAVYFGSDMSGRRDNRGYGQNLFGDNFTNSLVQRGVSAGMGFANSAVESSILGLMGSDSPYGNGKARLNFMWHLDDKGKSRFSGEGDILWPLYDSLHTTIYTQFGARSMYGGGSEYGPDRWIGNIGIGQRWFPAAKIVRADRTSAAPQGSAAEPAQDRALGRSGASDSSSPTGRGGERNLDEDGKPDSGNWMLGYNAFYDVDITRGHERGGVGLEAQYDWLKVSTNWYLPISDWKDSADFDGDYVRERAAQGWDFRVKGYLPFYREIAVTGAFTQWYGDYVGMFGPSKLEKDPKVWSYGLEYTPVPALTAYVNQRQSERGRSDTEFGLRFTYHFGMDAKEQFKPSRVAQMRTVHGSRHDFVDRENKIILEYQPKNSIYIDFVSANGTTFLFRIRDGFSKNKVGQEVQVTLMGTTTLAVAPTQPDAAKSFFAEALDSLRQLFAGTFSVSLAHADSSKSYITDSNGLIHVRVDDVNKLIHLQVGAGEAVRTYDRSALTLPPAPEITLTAEKTSLADQSTTTLTLTNALINSAVTWKVEGAGGSVAGGDKTDATGKATATFTASGTGTATVTATAAKESASTVLTITAAAYTLEATPDTLKQHEAKNVTFTVKKNTVALANTSVTLKGTGFTGLPLTQDTNGSGQITVNLTATATGAQTVELEVGGITVASKNITVSVADYGLTANPNKLTLSTATAVTFTLTANGAKAPENIDVTLTAGPSGLTIEPPATGRTDADGQFTATLTGTSSGDKVVTATTVDGQTADASITVNPPLPDGLTLVASETNPGESASSIVTATLVIGGVPASGKTVTFTWKVKGTTEQQGSATGTTDANGKATYTLTGTGDHRTLTVTAEAEGKSDSKDVQFGIALPSGFIVLAGGTKNWFNALTYCGDQGGGLPRINNSDSWNGNGSASIEGFGNKNDSWPSVLPVDGYWTGTEDSINTSNAWFVGGTVGGVVFVFNDGKSLSYRVACVP